MSINLNDREELTCRLALILLTNKRDYESLRTEFPGLLTKEEIEELVHTMGPNTGKAFNTDQEPDPMLEVRDDD